MTYKTIFVDSDILLDLFLERKPFDSFSKILLQQGQDRQITLFTSTLIFANIHYLLSKYYNKHIAKEQLKGLTGFMEILPFESDNLHEVLNGEHVDFEDAIQYTIAKKHKCDLIVTRNIKHYKKFSLPALSAEQFLEIL